MLDSPSSNEALQQTRELKAVEERRGLKASSHAASSRRGRQKREVGDNTTANDGPSHIDTVRLAEDARIILL